MVPSRGTYFSHPACLAHDPRAGVPGHPEVPERLQAIERELGVSEGGPGALDRLGFQRIEAPAAEEQELELVHGREHVRLIRDLALTGGGAIDPDTFVGEPSFLAASHAAGGACEMTRELVGGATPLGFCGVRPAGHHAEADRAMGFCLFNNVALAAELATAELGAGRVFILDWDVHHGNGTAEIFRHRPDVLFASIHQSGIYPGTGEMADAGSGAGEGYTINLPVPGGSGEELWLSLIEHILVPVAEEFTPDLILVSAGFDAHREDPLAGCLLETESFARMARIVRDLARSSGAPLGLVLEGGYEPQALAHSVLATLSALVDDEPAPSGLPETPLSARAAAHFRRYWSL